MAWLITERFGNFAETGADLMTVSAHDPRDQVNGHVTHGRMTGIE